MFRMKGDTKKWKGVNIALVFIKDVYVTLGVVPIRSLRFVLNLLFAYDLTGYKNDR